MSTGRTGTSTVERAPLSKTSPAMCRPGRSSGSFRLACHPTFYTLWMPFAGSWGWSLHTVTPCLDACTLPLSAWGCRRTLSLACAWAKLIRSCGPRRDTRWPPVVPVWDVKIDAPDSSCPIWFPEGGLGCFWREGGWAGPSSGRS